MGTPKTHTKPLENDINDISLDGKRESANNILFRHWEKINRLSQYSVLSWCVQWLHTVYQ